MTDNEHDTELDEAQPEIQPDPAAPKKPDNTNRRRKGLKDKGSNSKEAVAVERLARQFELSVMGASQREIALATDTPLATVKDRLSRFREIFRCLDDVDAYRVSRLDLLDSTEFMLLKTLCDPVKLAKAPLYAVAQAFKEVATLRRLESGKSTQNTAVSFVSVNPSK